METVNSAATGTNIRVKLADNTDCLLKCFGNIQQCILLASILFLDSYKVLFRQAHRSANLESGISLTRVRAATTPESAHRTINQAEAKIGTSHYFAPAVPLWLPSLVFFLLVFFFPPELMILRAVK